jgi:hypothetical protein
MGINTLASTTFSSGPDDEQVVADIYDITEPGVINSIDADDAYNNEIANRDVSSFSGGDLDAIQNKKLAAKDALDAQLTTRLSNDASSALTQLKSLSDVVKKNITINPILGRVITATLGTKKANILTQHLNDAKAVTRLIDNFAKGNGGYGVGFTDKGAISGLIAGLATEGSRLGLPSTFTKLAGAVTSKGPLMAAASMLLPKAAKSGDLNLLRDVADSVIKDDIYKIMPSVISENIKNFSLPKPLSLKDAVSKYDLLNSTFSDIKTDWNKVSRNGVSTLSGLKLGSNPMIRSLLSSKVMSQTEEVVEADYGFGINSNAHSQDEKFTLPAAYSLTDVTGELEKSFPSINVKDDLFVKEKPVFDPQYI